MARVSRDTAMEDVRTSLAEPRQRRGAGQQHIHGKLLQDCGLVPYLLQVARLRTSRKVIQVRA